MSELTPREIEKLVLGYEELDPADKALADTYLSQQPELTARLKWHQDKEAVAVANIPLRDDFWRKDALLPSDEEAQLDSLRRILDSLDQVKASGQGNPTPPTKIISFTDRLRHQALWVLPLAAVLALTIFIPRNGVDQVLMENLRISRVELQADGSRGTGQTTPVDGVLRTGQAFALDFSLNKDAYVVVYHVGPAGQVSQVYPGTITDTLSPHRGGQGHQIPDPDSGEVWILGSETGTESFLVASSKELPSSLDTILTDRSVSDRADVLAGLQFRLKTVMEQVNLYEFQHVD